MFLDRFLFTFLIYYLQTLSHLKTTDLFIDDPWILRDLIYGVLLKRWDSFFSLHCIVDFVEHVNRMLNEPFLLLQVYIVNLAISIYIWLPLWI